MKEKKIYLSPPNVGPEESEMLNQVINDGWISSVGPSINQFEKNLEQIYSSRRVLALNSGTSALHLSLVMSEIGKGDQVLVSAFTFAACANAILYQGAIPVFLDSEKDTWNMDPELLKEFLECNHEKPKAVIVTHLYGISARINEIKNICYEYGIVLIEDAAEAVGSTINGQPLGSFGDFGILSFNGNKIITTSAGGALITSEDGYKKGLHLATQANTGKSDYDHDEVGYNYRMSNVLAGIGIVQLAKLEKFVARKRSIFSYYKEQLSEWFDFLEEPENSLSNRWLTTPLAKDKFEVIKLIEFLAKNNIESRRLWRPLHLHSAYDHFDFIGTGISESIYEKGICLPSGTNLSNDQIDFVTEKIIQFIKH